MESGLPSRVVMLIDAPTSRPPSCQNHRLSPRFGTLSSSTASPPAVTPAFQTRPAHLLPLTACSVGAVPGAPASMLNAYVDEVL